jgi:hypothetical protein
MAVNHATGRIRIQQRYEHVRFKVTQHGILDRWIYQQWIA